MKRNLALFDVDGALTRSAEVDAACFARAFEESLLIRGVGRSRHPDATVAAIARRVFVERKGRSPRASQLARLQRRFIELLSGALAADPSACPPVPGAGEALAMLRGSEDWAVAIASGSWRAAVSCKARCAGLDLRALPAAFADDAASREELVALAIGRARDPHLAAGFERVVLVGDGVWGLRAARRAGLAFLGLGNGDGARRLRREGAARVFSHYRPLESLLGRLERAAPPRGTRPGAGRV